MLEQKEIEEKGKAYKRPVIYLRKSRAGEHLFAFNVDGALGGDVESLIANLGEVKKVMNGELKWCKVSVMAEKEGE